jgi:hypothetical protein
VTDETNDKPVLIVVEGPLAGQQWVMHGQSLTIGRGGHCNVVLPERRVSREHVRIWREGAKCYVEDLNSKNGTHINGARLEGQAELQEGDELQIALCVRLKFVGSEATVPLSLDAGESSVGLRLDEHTHQVVINGQVLAPQLSLHQYRLLRMLYQLQEGVCTRDDVVNAVWPDAQGEGVSEQAIDALVRRLRDRLAELDTEHQYILTVRGHGFRLEQPKGHVWHIAK